MLKAEASKPWLGIVVMLLALLGFDAMGILVRMLLERGYGAAELSAYRNLLGVAPSLIVLAWMGELRLKDGAMRVKRWKLALFRGLTVALAQLCFYTALGFLELATVSALAQTNALFVVLLSVAFLGEKVGPWRIFALVLGFAGALWVMRPGSDTFTLAALLPVAASLFYGFSIVSVRFFDASVSSALLYVYASAASIVTAFLLAWLTTGFSPLGSPVELLMIFSMSMAGGIAVLVLMLAYRMTVPSLLAPFSYFTILSAFFFGWFFFDETPVDTLFPGVLLIVGAGAVIIWRENRARKA